MRPCKFTKNYTYEFLNCLVLSVFLNNIWICLYSNSQFKRGKTWLWCCMGYFFLQTKCKIIHIIVITQLLLSVSVCSGARLVVGHSCCSADRVHALHGEQRWRRTLDKPTEGVLWRFRPPSLGPLCSLGHICLSHRIWGLVVRPCFTIL